MRRRIRPLFALLSLLALAPACTKSDAPGTVDKPAPEAQAPAPEAAPAPAPVAQAPAAPADAAATVTTSAPPEIEVLDAGQEPREPLRVKVQAGQRETMIMVMTMGMGMDMGGLGGMPFTKMPPIEMKMDLHITSVSDTGDFRYEFNLAGVDIKDAPGTMPELREAMKGAMAGMVGLSGHSVVSNRGEVREAGFKVPPNATPQVKQTLDGMQQSIQQIAIPFPEEAVGVGARWKVTSKLAQVNGIALNQESTYEIVERDGDTLKMKTAIVQSAPPQQIKAPGMPATASVFLESMASSGDGQTAFDLNKVVPVEGNMSLGSKMAMNVDAGGQKQSMSMKMDLDLGIRSN